MRRLPAIALAVLVGSPSGCGGRSDGAAPDGGAGDAPGTPADVHRQVLAALGEHVILATYVDFEAKAAALETAAKAFAASDSAADRDAAREAWKAAMAVWQEAELFQLGPAGAAGKVAGGEDLRDEVYSWPLVNRCRVDQETLEGAFADPAAFAKEAVNVRGLDAIEQLLFFEGTENHCAPQSEINASGAWDAAGAEAIAKARADYAATLAVLVHDTAAALVSKWSPEDGDFLGALATAGAGSDVFPTAQTGLESVSDALFYLDIETKDAKIAKPAGLSDCDAEVCPDALESAFARRSKEHVRANLLGFRKAVLGAGPEAPGFDDLLVAVGAGDVATAIAADLEAALAAVDAIEGDLADALADEAKRAQVEALHAAVKAVTDRLKSDFVTVLDLDVPDRAAGDND